MIGATRYSIQAEINRQARLADEIAHAQAEISTGKRLQKASDDPAAAARVAEIRKTQANHVVWKANIDAAAALADQADSTLTGVGTAMDRARELMLAASNGTLTDSDRAAIVTELRGIVTDIATLKAAKDSRGYDLFPVGGALLVPIAEGVNLAATSGREAVFEGIVTSGGPMTLEAIITAAADALELPLAADRVPATTDALAAIAAASDHVAAVRGEQGVRAARIDALAERLAANGLLLDEERGTLEGTDITRTVAELNAKMLTLEAAQAAFARTNRSTLFDLLG